MKSLDARSFADRRQGRVKYTRIIRTGQRATLTKAQRTWKNRMHAAMQRHGQDHVGMQTARTLDFCGFLASVLNLMLEMRILQGIA